MTVEAKTADVVAAEIELNLTVTARIVGAHMTYDELEAAVIREMAHVKRVVALMVNAADVGQSIVFWTADDDRPVHVDRIVRAQVTGVGDVHRAAPHRA